MSIICIIVCKLLSTVNVIRCTLIKEKSGYNICGYPLQLPIYINNGKIPTIEKNIL